MLLALFLAAFSGGAFAAWTEIERFEDGLLVFVDQASVRRSGEAAVIAELTHLVRWPEPQVEDGVPPYRSTIVRAAYDCREKRERYLGSTSYAGAMGGGVKVQVDGQEASAWTPISAASMEEKLWTIACAAP